MMPAQLISASEASDHHNRLPSLVKKQTFSFSIENNSIEHQATGNRRQDPAPSARAAMNQLRQQVCAISSPPRPQKGVPKQWHAALKLLMKPQTFFNSAIKPVLLM